MLIQMTIAQLKAVHSKQRNQKAKIQVTKLGANWNNASNASAFYWNLNNVSSNRNRNISSQAVNALKRLFTHHDRFHQAVMMFLY